MEKINSTTVARSAGVSQSTVSRVMNNSPKVDDRTRRLVLEAAARIGYPVRNRGKSLRVGLVMSQNSPIGSYQAMAVSALKADLYRRNWSMEIVFNEDLGTLGTRALSGAVSISGDPELNRKWSSFTTLPLVRFAAKSSHSDNIYSVATDAEVLLRRAVVHLREAGHRRIGLLLRRTRGQDEALTENLGLFFQRIMPGFGMADPETFLSHAHPGVTLQERLSKLLERGVTALVIVPGDTALEVCAELRKRRLRIPEDISIVARDFAGVSEFWNPPLTSLRPDYARLSSAALDLLENLVFHRSPATDILIPGELVIRSSVHPV